MAYGRLEVFFPDGRLETYLLEDESVSVGRADGNIIPLDTDSISRYHFSIVHQENKATITDLESANGTYVDGIQLQSNTPHILGDVEEILVGSLRIIYRQVDDSPTEMVHVLDEETQQMEIQAQVRVEVDYKELKVWPAASSSTELAITNLSNAVRDYSIDVNGLPNGWLRLTRPEIQLDPNETAFILVNIKPPRRPNTVPQHYEAIIEVAPIDDPARAVYSYLDVEIKSYSGFGMAVGKQVDVGDPVPIFLHNQGSGKMRVTLTAKDHLNELVFRGPQAPLELQAGQRLQINLHVDSKNPTWVGQSKERNFLVQAQSHDASRFIAASDAQVTIGPRIPTWAAIAGVGVALSVIIIAFLGLLGILNPPNPEIEALSIAQLQVAQGEVILVEIEAARVDTFDILLNQSLVAEGLDGSIDDFSIETDNVSGVVDITIIARNGTRSASESVSATVYVPVGVNSFSASPNPMVRNTVTELRVSWDIAGAVVVRISGLSDFTNNMIQASEEYPAVHTLDVVPGIPEQALELILFAEDESGTTIEESLIISVIEPQCTAINDVQLHEGPDTGFQQVATVPAGTTVTVLAKDADAGWLRFQLPQDLLGWGQQDAFDCADNFNVADLRLSSNVPVLPTETIVPVVTLTPVVAPTIIPVDQPTATPENN